ncbi:ankyrin repeat domain-containing protein [Candidatus Wolbachia massiliensis]|uniref:Ankyrin repeat domain-containing protein n=1 Tax=Candidatus Wolbachia massiliensis TaxID=1845000 RepID=A0A7L7YME0_9RICK|nr:ankyrin repeat domain-containing protein [Candidatus Wolbachia massiliensis]QOD38383.1 ankyrin repeat domain-containing protein [Candidatus Wolbachia massiliensis]
MAIEKEKFFEIIKNVSEVESLSKDNLLTKIKNELKEKDIVEYNKFDKEFSKEYQFGIKISEETVEDWTLLHLVVACNNLLMLELLLKKQVSVSTRVKDGSKDDGPTALHMAAFYGHENMVKRLLNDNRVNPSLKSKNKTPREMIDGVPNRDAIVEMLEIAEKNYSPKKAKDLNIKTEGGGRYHLSQGSHGTATSSTVNGNPAPANDMDPYLKQHGSIRSDKSISSDDSGLELEQSETASSTSFNFEMNLDEVNHVEELENKLRELHGKIAAIADFSSKREGELNDQLNRLAQEKKDLESKVERLSREANQLKRQQINAQQQLDDTLKKLSDKDSRIQELEGSDEELKRVEKKLEKAQKELEELKSRADVGATNESWTPLHNTIKISDVYVTKNILKTGKIDLNATDKDGWTVLHHAIHNGHLDKVKYLVEEGADFEIKDKGGKSPLDLAVDNQNNEIVEFLQEKIRSRAGLNEGELEKTGKRQFSSKIAYASLATMLAVGTILSIASGLSVLLIIAASVTSALIAGGITYTMSKPTTELKEVDIQGTGQQQCKT